MNLFDEIHRILVLQDAGEKCHATHQLKIHINDYTLKHDTEVLAIEAPGYPPQLELVAPRELKKRSIQNQQGRNILLHAVAHIEFNAINLALDAAYRFRNEPIEFYQDWINIADDEARHFAMIRAYLNKNDCDYGDFRAHNGLWEMAQKTSGDIVARMALVPRVLEARGLDVTPGMIDRLEKVADDDAVAILKTIYNDEIQHVRTGSQWFFYNCEKRNLEPRSTFIKMVDQHLHGQLRGPFNLAARLQAGFDEIEMLSIEAHSNL